MKKLEKIQSKILDDGINIYESHNEVIKVAAVEFDNKKAIFFDESKFDNSSEMHVALAHEYHHFKTHTLYNFLTDDTTKRKCEYRANKSMIQDIIPIKEFRKALLLGLERYELAEEFDVTEDTIDLAYMIYKNMGEL